MPHLERQRDDAGAEPDAPGVRRRLGEEHEGRRQAALGLVEMVLGDPGRLVAAALGLLDLRDRQPIALGRVGLVEQAGEETQPLDGYLCRHQPNLAWKRGAASGMALVARHPG
jgi:hypothetical protein